MKLPKNTLQKAQERQTKQYAAFWRWFSKHLVAAAPEIECWWFVASKPESDANYAP
jgi:hypothetical protein